MECQRRKRSVSPNHVMINGLVIDGTESLERLGNITEESEPVLHDLADAVESADHNVQNFIDEVTSSSVDEDPQDDLGKLASFLTSLDESSKTRIVETLINIYKKEILSSLRRCEVTTNTGCQYDHKDCPSSKLVHFKEDAECKAIQKKLKSLAKPYKERLVVEHLPKKLISQTEHILLKHQPSENSHVMGYEKLKKKWENPLEGFKQLVSEGIQAHTPTRKRRKPTKKSSVNYVKPFKYPKPSSSDMAINCPFGCPLRLKKSKSDVVIDRKSSRELLEAKHVRRKNQLIKYLDADLKRGDSSIQFSQILFETANKNMDNEVSNMEIPMLDNSKLDTFNANYLLHSLQLTSETKSSLVLSSDVSITEEDYIRWLKKRNLSKHYTKSEDELLSVSQMERPKKRKTISWNEPSKEPDVNLEGFLEDMGELFLYEHVVISRAIEFFLTLHVKRTKRFSKWERFLQIVFVVIFCTVWWYFNNYVYVDATLKKGTALWQ